MNWKILKKAVFVPALVVLAVVNAQEVAIVPATNDGVYRAGEAAIWNVSVTDADGPVNGDAKYTIKSGGRTVVREGSLEISNGTGTVTAVRTDPGSLLLEVVYEKGSGLGGAVFSPEAIQVSAPEPADFDAFWQSKIAELEAVPMAVELEKVEVPGDIDYWKITMDNIRGTRIHGQIAKPKNSTGKLPAMLQVQYAGVYPLQQGWVTKRAKQGWLAMNIIAHDLPIDREPDFYKAQAEGALKDYPKIGNEDRDTSYFLRMYLSCYRAVDYLVQRPDWDGKVLLVTGGSQGGLQSVVASGLHPAVTAIMARVPAGCDHTGPLVDRRPGWPNWLNNSPDKDPAKLFEACRYYDAVNFARRVKCPALIGVGLIDTTCPPAGVIAMYNQLSGPKRLVVMPVSGHKGVNGSQKPFMQVADQWADALRTGQPLPLK